MTQHSFCPRFRCQLEEAVRRNLPALWENPMKQPHATKLALVCMAACMLAGCAALTPGRSVSGTAGWNVPREQMIDIDFSRITTREATVMRGKDEDGQPVAACMGSSSGRRSRRLTNSRSCSVPSFAGGGARRRNTLRASSRRTSG